MLVRTVEKAGQMDLVFSNAVIRFRLLNALLASTKRIASVLSFSKICLTVHSSLNTGDLTTTELSRAGRFLNITLNDKEDCF